MSIGAEYHVKVHTDSTNRIVFDSLSIHEFTHDGSFNGGTGTGSVTSVKVDDYPGRHLDSYEVTTAYAAASIPATSTTLNTILGSALTAIQAVVPGGVGGGTPSIDPSL